ncbi:fasciclin-like arabinogalactan protein 11 [Carya illinoinensis]|uniref:FAS1 domain-containing protein n=1 Tax=Carya illinoinensis TaxID=32201 RepID=A0A8T1NHT2_CARIL|nr:fasciclin-like arabinogalactan protein 11 [Carya illinoinensis]KAG6629352.1 hypothetical protein CIPAW_14G078700 [Carya illinoinensis]KAG6678467.1 hypothetical protein I3842_14G081500 [Carya illinoinensis]
MTKQAIFFLSLLHVFLFHCTITCAQAPDITQILDKYGDFKVLIRLLKNTGVADQLNGELAKSNTGYTFFAAPDKAFSELRTGTINKLSDLQKVQFLQFHILATYVTLTNFQTLSNPVPTQAGDTTAGQFPLNVTSSDREVHLSTGVVNATLGTTLYSDNNLAVYQVDKVLLPLDIFSDYKPPEAVEESTPPLAATVDKSGAVTLAMHAMFVLLGIAVNVGAVLGL